MSGRAHFDPTDAFDACAHFFKSEVAELALQAFADKDFRSLATHKQIECLTAGILTGLMGSVFSMCVATTEAHDELERFVTEYIPQARAQAEDIDASGEPRQ